VKGFLHDTRDDAKAVTVLGGERSNFRYIRTPRLPRSRTDKSCLPFTVRLMPLLKIGDTSGTSNQGLALKRTATCFDDVYSLIPIARVQLELCHDVMGDTREIAGIKIQIPGEILRIKQRCLRRCILHAEITFAENRGLSLCRLYLHPTRRDNCDDVRYD